MKGRSSGRYSLSTDVGSGSRVHDLHGKQVMMVLTSSMETGLRVSRVCVDGGRNERAKVRANGRVVSAIINEIAIASNVKYVKNGFTSHVLTLLTPIINMTQRPNRPFYAK